jgi:dipeptidase D
MNVSIEEAAMPSSIINDNTKQNLLNALYACPHGVMAMSQEIQGFVQTSTNLASVKMKEGEDKIFIATSQRSSFETEKDDIANMVESVFRMAGGKVEHSTGYPGWKPNPVSEILEITKKAYKDLFGNEPKVLIIHAGLECGLIGEKYPGMDMISYGPTLRGVHSPDERLEIATVDKFWKLTLEVLKRIEN